ncbi:hypothetical protein Vafri_7257, partial [Volvox africanus]
ARLPSPTGRKKSGASSPSRPPVASTRKQAAPPIQPEGRRKQLSQLNTEPRTCDKREQPGDKLQQAASKGAERKPKQAQEERPKALGEKAQEAAGKSKGKQDYARVEADARRDKRKSGDTADVGGGQVAPRVRDGAPPTKQRE